MFDKELFLSLCEKYGVEFNDKHSKMNSKEKIKEILDWTEGWAHANWGYMALLRQELEELVEIAKNESHYQDLLKELEKEL